MGKAADFYRKGAKKALWTQRNTMIKTHITALLLMFLAGMWLPGYGQGDQLMIANSGLSASNPLQPAHLAPLGPGATRVGIDFGTHFFSTDIRYGWLDQPDQFLNEAEKSAIIDALAERSDLWVGAAGQVQVQRNIEGHRLSLGYRQGLDLKASIDGQDLARLVLNGNAPYQGQTLAGEDLRFQRVTTRELQLGYARAHGDREQFRWGIHFSGIQGISGQFFQVNPSSLYTGPDGDSVLLNADYEEFAGQSGWGFSGAAGVEYQINPMLRVQAALGNLGSIRWRGSGRMVDASFGSAGIEGGPLFRHVTSLNDSLFELDTLNQLFLPNRSEGSYVQRLLPRGHVAAAVRMNHWEVMGSVLFQQWLDGRVLPGASLSVMYGFFKEGGMADINSQMPFLRLGANLSMNQWQQFGLGAVARGFLHLADSHFLSLYAMADQLQAWVMPQSGTAGSVRVGVMYVFW